MVRANAFLHHMVRNIVGTLVYVGKGKPSAALGRARCCARRTAASAAPTFGAEGLYLEKIEYEAELAACRSNC